MDRKSSGKESHQIDATRELLIAISFPQPYEETESSENMKKEKLVGEKQSDVEEKYRSELMAISETKPADCTRDWGTGEQSTIVVDSWLLPHLLVISICPVQN